MKSTNNFRTSNPETVTISRAEYEEKNAKLAAQDERIAELEQQFSVLMEALRLAGISSSARPPRIFPRMPWSS